MSQPVGKILWAMGSIILATGLLSGASTPRQTSSALSQKSPALPLDLPSGMRVFPKDNAWNEDISLLPIDPKSAELIAQIGASKPLHPDFGGVWEGAPAGIPFVVVSGKTARQPVTFDYADESDAGPYPIPGNPIIEGNGNPNGDRHLLMVDRDNQRLYELFALRKEGNRWHAGSGAIFALNSNALRPPGWTSADAAGLPIFPGLVRYDEAVIKGEIDHAFRFTVRKTRKAYVFPARHWASHTLDPALPPMGMRVRLKAGVDLTKYPRTAQVILKALKKYGMLLADNGSDLFVSGATDSRWKTSELEPLKRIKGSDFEVVLMKNIIVSDR